mmetsp:Transcript_30774/g.98276  ORF Transcript_30774/g.98276 Transcript_30774/m.98276 type:complete len:266 (-) Transcript_30774:1114-1911(-)
MDGRVMVGPRHRDGQVVTISVGRHRVHRGLPRAVRVNLARRAHVDAVGPRVHVDAARHSARVDADGIQNILRGGERDGLVAVDSKVRAVRDDIEAEVRFDVERGLGLEVESALGGLGDAAGANGDVQLALAVAARLDQDHGVLGGRGVGRGTGADLDAAGLVHGPQPSRILQISGGLERSVEAQGPGDRGTLAENHIRRASAEIDRGPPGAGELGVSPIARQHKEERALGRVQHVERLGGDSREDGAHHVGERGHQVIHRLGLHI